MGFSPKWAASLQLFSIMREEPSADRPMLLVCSGWIRTLNTPDSLQVSGPCLFSSHHHPRTTGEARFTSPDHLREHRNASWKLPPSLPGTRWTGYPHHRALLSTHTGAGLNTRCLQLSSLKNRHKQKPYIIKTQ